MARFVKGRCHLFSVSVSLLFFICDHQDSCCVCVCVSMQTTPQVSFEEFVEWYSKIASQIGNFHKKKHVQNVTTPSAAPKSTIASKEIKRQIMLVQSHCAINMAVSILNFSTRGEILLQILKGDYQQVGFSPPLVIHHSY